MHRGRARVDIVPTRPADIAWVASGVVAKRCSVSAIGSARSSPSVLACHSSVIGVPRTSRADERAPAHLGEDRVAQGRAPRRRRPRPPRSRPRGSRTCRCRAVPDRCAPSSGPRRATGRRRAARRASAARRAPTARCRGGRRADASAPPRRPGDSAGTARWRSSPRGRGPGAGRARCRPGGAPAGREARSAARPRATTSSVRRRARVNARAAGRRRTRRPSVVATPQRGASPRLGHRAPRLVGEPEDLGRERRPAAAAGRQRDARRPARTKSSSPSSRRSAATAAGDGRLADPELAAAAFTDPSRATVDE